MNTKNIVRLLSNFVYAIGTALVVILSAVWLFGPDEAVNPLAMLPLTWKEQAFVWLAVGAVPMLVVCAMVYVASDMWRGFYKKRMILLVFLPGLVCAACALYLLGLIVAGVL